MKTMLFAAVAALSLAATGATAFAGEGNGPDFPAYNAAVAAAQNHAIIASVPTITTGNSEAYPTFAGRDVQVQSNVASIETGTTPQFFGQAAQFPGGAPTATVAAGSVAQGGQG